MRSSQYIALPAGVFLAGVALSGWQYTRMERARTVYEEARRDSIITSVEDEIRERLATYESALRAAAGVFSSSGLPSREGWKTYVNQIEFYRDPGTILMAVIQPIPQAKLEEFVQGRRRSGDDFTVRAFHGLPSLPFAEHFLAVQAEPFSIAQRSLGTDLTGDPARRSAAEQARDSGLPVLTKNAVLFDGDGRALQLFVPIYRSGAPKATIEERRAACMGWVTVLFAADPFFRSATARRQTFLDLSVFEDAVTPNALLFASGPAKPQFEITTRLDLGGITWRLGWNRTPGFPSLSKAPAVLAAACGILLSAILAALVLSLQSNSRKAQRMLAIKQQQAEETQSFLASIVQSSEDSIIGTLLDGTIVSWNRGAEHLWGYTSAEAIGQNIRILFRPAFKEDLLSSLERIKRAEFIERFESVRVKKDGTAVNVSVILSPITNPRGELVGVSAIYHDITELLRAKDAAETANRAKSEFLANMSHEIRTPMNGVLGMTDILLETDLTSEQREYLTVVKGSGDALLAVINDILDFSKIEVGKLALSLAEFDVRECVGETIRLFALGARQKGIALVCDVHDSVPSHAVGDELRIRQILVNLVGNALKFTHRGTVTVSVEARPRVQTGPGKGLEMDLHFSVKDTGIGISPDKLKTVFQPFTQADNSTTRQYGGTGLGLTISTRLVELMSGRISLESVPEQGSTFSFVIPAGVSGTLDETASPASEGIPLLVHET